MTIDIKYIYTCVHTYFPSEQLSKLSPVCSLQQPTTSNRPCAPSKCTNNENRQLTKKYIWIITSWCWRHRCARNRWTACMCVNEQSVYYSRTYQQSGHDTAKQPCMTHEDRRSTTYISRTDLIDAPSSRPVLASGNFSLVLRSPDAYYQQLVGALLTKPRVHYTVCSFHPKINISTMCLNFSN